MQLSMFSLEELPAKVSVSQDSEQVWLTRVVHSCSPILALLADTAPDGWSGKTSPVSCLPMEDGTLRPYSGGWLNAGMGSPTAFLTLDISESPSVVVASSLSDIVQTGDVPQRYYLSETACLGVLRRLSSKEKDRHGGTATPSAKLSTQCCTKGR